MGFLDRFKPQPRWKHPDAHVRLAAVDQLSDEEQDLLKSLATEDADAAVRRAAVSRLSDPATLVQVVRADSDEAVRAEAREVLVGIAQDSTAPDEAAAALEGLDESRELALVARHGELESTALAALERIVEPRVVAVVARQAGHAAVRMAALARVAEREDLVAIASKSDHRDVTLAALDRLTERDDLELVATRARSKAAARRARGVLRSRDEAERLPQLEMSRRVQVCESLESLGTVADLGRLGERLAVAEVEWEALSAGAPQELVDRFETAARAVRLRLAQTESERAEHEERVKTMAAEVGQAAASRLELCEKVEVLEGEHAAAILDEARTLWVALTPWPDAARDSVQARELSQRFERACADCEGRVARAAEAVERRDEFERMLDKAREAVERADLSSARQAFGPIRQAWLRLAAEGAPEPAHVEGFRSVEQRLSAREAAAREARARETTANHQRLEAMCARVEALTATPDAALRDIERAVRDARAAIEHTGPLPSRRDHDIIVERLRKVHAALYPRLQELRDAEDWRRWANAGLQEELAVRAEALKSIEDSAEVAKQLRALSAEWKKVGPAPREQAEALWLRFKAATDEARGRCAEYFQDQREQEQAALQMKEAICAQAEALADSTDWIRTAEELKRLQSEWQKLGPVGRDQNRLLWNRFRTACDRFFTRRKQDLVERKHVWSDNLKRKEAICARAEELSASTDWAAAAAEIKRLQAEWKTIGPVKRNKSEVVWQRFRSACDTFFDRYKRRDELESADAVQAREAVCLELEGLSAAAEAPDDLAAKVLAAWQQWSEAPKLPRPKADELDRRFTTAALTIAGRWPDRFRGTRLDVESNLKKMGQLCERVEGYVAGRVSANDLVSAAPQELATRLKDALAANTLGGRVDEEARRRAAVTAVREAQTAWRRIGPVPVDEERVLSARFHKACRKFFEQPAATTSPPRPTPA